LPGPKIVARHGLLGPARDDLTEANQENEVLRYLCGLLSACSSSIIIYLPIRTRRMRNRTRNLRLAPIFLKNPLRGADLKVSVPTGSRVPNAATADTVGVLNSVGMP
jgi:hypothetical protein